MLLSGSFGPREAQGGWVLSLAGGAPRKLFDRAWAAVLSPDDSKIVFVRGRGIWAAETAGGAQRELVAPRPQRSPLESLAWSPDGRRILFGTRSFDGDEVTFESCDLATGRTTRILSDPKAQYFCWARDGRMIYTRREEPPNASDSNLWEIQVDPRTAAVRGRPRRLTEWSGFQMAFPGISRDGRRLFAIGNRWRSDVYLADLQGNRSPKRLTFEWLNQPTGWTRDSQAVLFDSGRSGSRNIFLQNIDTREAHALVRGTDQMTDPRLSPDGRWILYLAWPKIGPAVQRGEGRLMRTAIGTGTPEIVLRAAGFPTSEMPHPRFRCPSVSQSRCVLSEMENGQVVFTAFDPVAGRKGELIRMTQDEPILWDLSPDGRRLAVGQWHRGNIQLVSLAGQPAREFAVEGQPFLESVAWAADGKSLFATAFESQGEPLLRITLDGQARLLYRGSKYVQSPVPSPDGRYLAFTDLTVDSNAWVMENLR